MQQQYEDGEIIVTFKDDVPSHVAEQAITDLGLSIRCRVTQMSCYFVRVNVGWEDTWIARFTQVIGVERAERKLASRHQM